MNRVTIDADLAEKLSETEQPVQIYDDRGRLLGVFKSETYRMRMDEVIASCPVSEEELQRRSARKGGRTLKEIMDDLERRAS